MIGEIDLSHAREMMATHPEATRGLSDAEVATAWCDHQESHHHDGYADRNSAPEVATVMDEWRTRHPLGMEIARLRSEVERLKAERARSWTEAHREWEEGI